MASNMFLYWGTGNSWKPQIVLEEKGLAGYGNKKIDFSKGEQKSPEILALNPRGQVPTFKDGDVVINESDAICMYLEHKFSKQGTRLMPENKAERAQVLQRMFEATNLYNAMINDVIVYKRVTPEDQIDQEVLAKKLNSLGAEFQLWDGYLAKEVLAKKLNSLGAEFQLWDGYLAKTNAYIAGTKFTLADVTFFTLVAFAVRIDLDLAKFPALKDYYQKMKERPSIKTTWSPHWNTPGIDSSMEVLLTNVGPAMKRS